MLYGLVFRVPTPPNGMGPQVAPQRLYLQGICDIFEVQSHIYLVFAAFLTSSLSFTSDKAYLEIQTTYVVHILPQSTYVSPIAYNHINTTYLLPVYCLYTPTTLHVFKVSSCFDIVPINYPHTARRQSAHSMRTRNPPNARAYNIMYL